MVTIFLAFFPSFLNLIVESMYVFFFKIFPHLGQKMFSFFHKSLSLFLRLNVLSISTFLYLLRNSIGDYSEEDDDLRVEMGDFRDDVLVSEGDSFKVICAFEVIFLGAERTDNHYIGEFICLVFWISFV